MFKGYVCSKTRHETSMVEGNIYDKTIGFFIEYMDEFKHVKSQI